MIVLDASVILKWIFRDEDGEEKAKLYRESHVSGKEIIAVPDLLFFEIANVLATKTRLSQKDATEAFSLLWHFDFELFNFGLEEFLHAIVLSRRHKITLYDASYIELAQRLKCRFVTADRKFHEKIRSLGGVLLL
ncbi:MAG: type II toxin-antitoxin system VapC family toxin [Armatimonadetes bacterium]|nr:type II toxin-antitoxin system VapC family toxin [Armatimonadota bacterium]